VVALLLLAEVVGKEHGCTGAVAAIAAAIVAAGTIATDIAGDCPNTVMEGDIDSLRVCYTPYDTLE
jgi:hypothetical protein